MNRSEKTIFKSGAGYVVLLTKEFKNLNLGPKDKVNVYLDVDKVIVSKKDALSVLKPMGINEDVWKDFLQYIIRKYSKNIEEGIERELNKAIKHWLEEKVLRITFAGKTIYKKGA